MQLPKRSRLTTAILGLSLGIVATASQAQDAARPELNGIWTNMSLTNQTRPSGVEDLVVTAAVAQQIAEGNTYRSHRPGAISTPMLRLMKTPVPHPPAVSTLVCADIILSG